jgi:hypothetical protein
MGHRLSGIDDKIQENLLDLTGDDLDYRPVVIFRLDLNTVFAQVFFREQQHLFDQSNQIGRCPLGRLISREAEHAIYNRGGALPTFEYLLKSLSPSGRIVLGSQTQARVVDNRGQDVVEFVSDTGRQSTDATQPLRLE